MEQNEKSNNVYAYTLSEAATLLRMSPKSVRRQIDRGNLRRCDKFGRVLIPRKDVETFYDKHSSFAIAA
ncbi:MAG: helix-turn-helix domain-containing protein [Limisphaerales bacterium]